MKRKARLERESQPVMPPRPDLLDAVVGHRVMAQLGAAVRKGTVYRTLNRRFFPWRTILPLTGIDPQIGERALLMMTRMSAASSAAGAWPNRSRIASAAPAGGIARMRWGKSSPSSAILAVLRQSRAANAPCSGGRVHSRGRRTYSGVVVGHRLQAGDPLRPSQRV